MKQRLGIAQALFCRPRILICDEPTSALDPVGRRELLDILVNVKEQTTVLFSTHILSDVEHICDEIAFLHEGNIVLQGPLEKVRRKRRDTGVELELARTEEVKFLLSEFPESGHFASGAAGGCIGGFIFGGGGQMRAFLKKEWMEWVRTGRFFLVLLIFALFGIMNPAIAKLTPWMMEALSDSLAKTGIVTAEVTVDAFTSWTQFYKNIPMGAIVFVLLGSGIFPQEYQKGTLIPVVTRGLSRKKIAAAKSLMLLFIWTLSYLLCFGITYGYNAYFWDNGIAKSLFFAGFACWLFGIWLVALLVFFSAVSANSPQALLGAGGIVAACYLLGMIPRVSRYLPTKLLEGMPLLQGISEPGDYSACLAAALGMSLVCLGLAAVCFERRRL